MGQYTFLQIILINNFRLSGSQIDQNHKMSVVITNVINMYIGYYDRTDKTIWRYL